MVNGKRIAVVMPGVQRREDIERTVQELPDTVDIQKYSSMDHSTDGTVRIAKKLDVQIFIQ